MAEFEILKTIIIFDIDFELREMYRCIEEKIKFEMTCKNLVRIFFLHHKMRQNVTVAVAKKLIERGYSSMKLSLRGNGIKCVCVFIVPQNAE